MEVHLGGHLGFYGPGRRSRFKVHLDAETTLLELIRELGVPEAEIDLAAVNLAIVSLHEARVGDADRLDLYPPMGGGAPTGTLRLGGTHRHRGP
ncbi:MAG TPA: MoaD/ThiS family protein [Candidatus Limnocylindrales bacterium]